MKLCQTCSQSLAEPIKTCPSCGSEVANGLQFVDDFRILEVVHEGHASILCRAIREDDDKPVAIRLFTQNSGVDRQIAERLTSELKEIQKLPEAWFVQHFAIKCSTDGIWYRISEWLEAESWGDLLSSGRLDNPEVAYDLFQRLAAILDGLHQSGHFIPHLILNDILILKGEPDRVDVKIDYKLSRFLDPKMAQPGQMLQNLLICHPDIFNNRPLNFKTDIWSLGRIFTQVLTADLSLCDPLPSVKQDKFPKEIKGLILSMLAEDPDLRPHSMAEVSDALVRLKSGVTNEESEPSVKAIGEVKRLKKMVVLLSLFFAVAGIIGAVALFIMNSRKQDIESVLENYANRYAASVAFVVVEYQVKAGDSVFYRQRTEGTAFLIDSEGYLLTNRHVACPWLEDEGLYNIVGHIRSMDMTPRFDYQMYLWFEGSTAFNRLYGIGAGEDIEDVYDTASAYSRGGNPGVAIGGVARVPVRIGQMIRAPLRDDFAVLKIDRVPQNLLPLPLDQNLEVSKLKRLSPVIALGFPLGSRTQEDVINVSVTKGHIRRTFENFFQVDSSIYRGNSGGPIIDGDGSVIGIASAVATDVAVAPMRVITPLSDIGMVLPINRAVEFIDELKAGQPKWDGVVDLSVPSKIKSITELAGAGHWIEALQQAERILEDSNDPLLIMAAAYIYYCTDRYELAALLFEHALSIDADNYQAQLMLYLTKRRYENNFKTIRLQHLLNLDWRSPGEFYGYLAKILAGAENLPGAEHNWNNHEEKAWIHYIVGLINLEKNDLDRAAALFREAVMSSNDEIWVRYLALSELDRLSAIKPGGPEAMATLRTQLLKQDQYRLEIEDELEPLVSRFEQAVNDPEARRDIMLEILQLTPDNRRLRAYASFYGAMISDWQQALASAELYLANSGREDTLRLGTGLLEPALLSQLDKTEEARVRLNEFCTQTKTSWYLQICETLLDKRSEEALLEKAGLLPENILTAYTYLGMQAETEGEKSRAAQYYRESLGSYLEYWIEYELARHRYLKVRQLQKE